MWQSARLVCMQAADSLPGAGKDTGLDTKPVAFDGKSLQINVGFDDTLAKVSYSLFVVHGGQHYSR